MTPGEILRRVKTPLQFRDSLRAWNHLGQAQRAKFEREACELMQLASVVRAELDRQATEAEIEDERVLARLALQHEIREGRVESLKAPRYKKADMLTGRIVPHGASL